MRVEPYTIDSYIHIVKRGARGLPIVRDKSDKYRFVRSLYYLNDTFFYPHWEKETLQQGMFYRPPSWPKRISLVDVVAYTLMPNHFHLILREIKEGGVTTFMKKLGQSMTNHSNEKYHECGSLFQGAYRSKTVNSDEYLRYVAVYVMVKNTFEQFPEGGLSAAQKRFESAWKWAIDFHFSSLGDYTRSRVHSPVTSSFLLNEIFTPQSFKSFSQDVILSGKWKEQEEILE